MKFQEVINYVGPANIRWQSLLKCLKSAKTSYRKNITTVTFQTSEITTGDLSGRTPTQLGFIVWLPFDKLPPEMQASFRDAYQSTEPSAALKPKQP